MRRHRIIALSCALIALGISLTATPAEARQVQILKNSSGEPGTAAVATKVWAACGRTTKENKIVRTFERHRGNDGHGHVLRGGKSNLLCGTANFGYRHIQTRHQLEWQYSASLTSNNWRDVADFGIAWALRDPDKVTYRARNNQYCFSRVIFLVNKRTKTAVGRRIPNVTVDAKSGRIITAIPKSTQC